jgi:hypothetical protein
MSGDVIVSEQPTASVAEKASIDAGLIMLLFIGASSISK